MKKTVSRSKQISNIRNAVYQLVGCIEDLKPEPIVTTKHDLETDLKKAEWLVNKVCISDVYAQNLYAALCNNDFVKNDVWEVLKENTWSCSWRTAGRLVAEIRNDGDYLDWYCSGIDPNNANFVGESIVTVEIKQDLLRLGWTVV